MTSLDILVVDDERDLASGVADMLEADGHRVVLAYSARRALDLARARAFDMVFLDVKLPGLTGVDILLPLRRALPGKKIVLMTGYRIDNLVATVMLLVYASIRHDLVYVVGQLLNVMIGLRLLELIRRTGVKRAATDVEQFPRVEPESAERRSSAGKIAPRRHS